MDKFKEIRPIVLGLAIKNNKLLYQKVLIMLKMSLFTDV